MWNGDVTDNAAGFIIGVLLILLGLPSLLIGGSTGCLRC